MKRLLARTALAGATFAAALAVLPAAASDVAWSVSIGGPGYAFNVGAPAVWGYAPPHRHGPNRPHYRPGHRPWPVPAFAPPIVYPVPVAPLLYPIVYAPVPPLRVLAPRVVVPAPYFVAPHRHRHHRD